MAKRKSPASATDTKHVTGHDIQDAFNPSVPLYHQIYLQLKDELTDGIWYGSQSFYGEDELARTYGVSNITARKVLGKLAEEGLIQRSRGRRARVLAQPPEEPRTPARAVFPLAKSKSFTYKILSTGIEVATAEACAVFGLPPGSKLWTCRRLRTLEGRRHSISFHAQPIEIGQKHKLQKLKSLPMYQAITEAGITVTSTSRTVEARFPPLLVARYLGVNTHEPMLVYTYVLMDKNGGNVSWLRIFVHPNERIPTEYINYQTGFWSNDQR